MSCMLCLVEFLPHKGASLGILGWGDVIASFCTRDKSGGCIEGGS